MTEKLFSMLQYYYSQKKLTAVNCKKYANILELFLYYCNKYNKCYVLRFDFHFPKTINQNPLPDVYRELYTDSLRRNAMKEAAVSYFMKVLKRKAFDPVYLCATELSEKSDYEHFHLLLLLDGNKTDNIYNHIKLFEKIWYKKLQISKEQNAGLVQKSKVEQEKDGNIQKYNGIMLKRASLKFLDDLLYVLSFSEYLIKDKQKEHVVFRKKINRSCLSYKNGEDNPKIFAKNLLNSCRLKKEMDFSSYHFLDEKFKNQSVNEQEIEVSSFKAGCFQPISEETEEFFDVDMDEFLNDNLPVHYTTFDEDDTEKTEVNLSKTGDKYDELSVFPDNFSQVADDHPFGEEIESSKNEADLKHVDLIPPENFHEDDSPFPPVDSDVFDVPFTVEKSFVERSDVSDKEKDPPEENEEYYLELVRTMTFSKKEKECYLEDPEAYYEDNDTDEGNSYEW